MQLNLSPPVSSWGGKNGVSAVLGFSFACGRRPHAKLKCRTERDSGTVAANMNICIVNSDMVARPIELWALAQHTKKFSSGPGPALGPGRLGALGPGSIRVPGPWALGLDVSGRTRPRRTRFQANLYPGEHDRANKTRANLCPGELVSGRIRPGEQDLGELVSGRTCIQANKTRRTCIWATL